MPLQRPARDVNEVEGLLSEVAGQIQGIFSFFRIPPQDAEDLLQDTLLALVVKAGEIRSRELWLLQTLRHQCATYWRRRRRWIYEELDRALREEASSDDPIARQELRNHLNGAISKLPERCRSILRLRYALGCHTSEMADRLGYREGSVRKAEMRCLSALTKEIVGTEPVG